MPGLVPGIHVFPAAAKQVMDGRDGPGHDDDGARHGLLRNVMPGLVPGIHTFGPMRSKSWMAGTSPAMTTGGTERDDGTRRSVP